MSSVSPFGGPEHVLKYLARYTHRVAISNGRLLSLDNGQVRFRWRDSRHNNRSSVMTLDAVEFIRRFLLHVLPAGFVKIRHFGLLADRSRRQALTLCRLHLRATAVDLRTVISEQQKSTGPVPSANAEPCTSSHAIPPANRLAWPQHFTAQPSTLLEHDDADLYANPTPYRDGLSPRPRSPMP